MIVWDDNKDGHLKLWREWIESPEGRAREKLHAALTELRSDPEITASALCAEFLDLMLRLDPSDVSADTVFDLVEPLTAYFAKLQARRGAVAMLAENPKQAQKKEVHECWLLWQKHPDRYKDKAAFARDMLEKYEKLVSQQVIGRWCLKWERDLAG